MVWGEFEFFYNTVNLSKDKEKISLHVLVERELLIANNVNLDVSSVFRRIDNLIELQITANKYRHTIITILI